MRGFDEQTGSLFSYVSCEARVPADHPLRLIRAVVDEALDVLAPEFDRLYARVGRPGIAPEKLLRALLLQAFYSVRSERQLMEQIDDNLLSAGSSDWRWVRRCGMRPPSARTGIACWMATLPSACWPRSSRNRGSRP